MAGQTPWLGRGSVRITTGESARPCCVRPPLSVPAFYLARLAADGLEKRTRHGNLKGTLDPKLDPRVLTVGWLDS